jgi:biopolymer transport protein ExbD
VRRTHRPSSIITEINITPLTDVMLVLLIIFMVTATFLVVEPSLDVRLPSAVTARSRPEPERTITVSISQGGGLKVNGKPADREHLVEALLAAARNLPPGERLVMVRGDRDADYGTIVFVMDAARLVGLRQVALATEPPQAGERDRE